MDKKLKQKIYLEESKIDLTVFLEFLDFVDIPFFILCLLRILKKEIKLHIKIGKILVWFSLLHKHE